jgi:hypothetical protein
MSIRNLWFNHKIQSIEVFLARSFSVDDEHTKSLELAETEAEYDHAIDILLAYQEIVFRAVYSELNALVELELKNLAKSILEAKGENRQNLDRGIARSIIEQNYGINFENLPSFDEVNEVRKIMNAYKYDDGFSKIYEEVSPDLGWLIGYRETRYGLNQEKAYQSIQAVRKFMRALPGDRQEFPETRLKLENQQTIKARREAWKNLEKCGVLGHVLEDPVLSINSEGSYQADCQLCGKTFYHETEEILPFVARLDQCPGMTGLR